MSFKNSCTISSSHDFQANQQRSQRRSFFSKTTQLWFEVLPDLSPVLPGAPRLVVGAPRRVVGTPRLVDGAPRFFQACRQHSQTCCRHSQVLPGAPNVLSGAPRCSQTFHNHSYGTPVPVIRDPSYSEGRQKCPPRVWYSPEIDSSQFTLHILSDTPEGFQWLNYILVMPLHYPLSSHRAPGLHIRIHREEGKEKNKQETNPNIILRIRRIGKLHLHWTVIWRW